MTLERAMELRAACDYRGALAALATADDAPALLERSRLHEDLGDYTAAQADAERVDVLTGGAPSARARLAAVARVERRCDDALQILDGVPGPEALVERAGALEELAQRDEAERLFMSLEPESPRLRHAVRLGLGLIAIGRGRYEDAERALLAAIAGAEADFGANAIETGTALNALGMVFKYSGRFDEGVDLYRRALQILERGVGAEHPDVASIYHNLGGLEHARRNFAEAEPYARRSVELRRLCCEVRKVQPLARALRGHDAWITGLRRDQGATRSATPVVAEDAAHGGIAKVAPLATWTGAQVWEYVRRHDVPRHPLYDRGYTSIGCEPCTRPTAPGEDERAGRWWWEEGAKKECGIHFAADGTIVRHA